MNPALERLIWVTNGLIVVLFSTADHLLTLALLASVGAFVWVSPNEQRSWAIGAGVLSVVASAFALSPIPVFLLVMSLGGWVALVMEKYNHPAIRWNIIRGISIYAVSGMGYSLYRGSGASAALASDPQMAQGAVYINMIAGVAMYAIPLIFMGMLTQSIWAHPPAPGGRPAQLISTIRTRGKD